MAYNNPYASNDTFNYFKPTSNYGSTSYGSGQFATTPIGDTYLQNQKDASFTTWLGNQGFRDNTSIGDYARAQRSKINEGYGAAMAQNPNLRYFTQYLNGDLAGRLREDFSRMTPGQRGESQAQFAPRARQSMR